MSKPSYYVLPLDGHIIQEGMEGKAVWIFFPAGDVFCLVERLGGLSIAAAELKQLIGLVKPPEDEEKVRNGQVSLE